MSRIAALFARWLLAALGLGLLLLPIVWIGGASLVPEDQLFAGPWRAPTSLGLQHYRALFSEHDIWTPIRNSLLVAGSTTALCVILGSACAYALARLGFAGKALISGALLAVSMFPQISVLAPLYVLLRALGLLDTYPGLVLPYLSFALPLTILLLVRYFRQLPAEIEQAAMLDGASTWRVLWQIVLPLALPGLVSTGLICFIYCWNEFLFAMSFTVGPEHQTLPVAVALLRGRHQIPWGEVFAAAVVATAPVLALVLLFQRRIVSGLAPERRSAGGG